VVAAYTDSPCLKLKPVSAINKHGYLLLGLYPTGGPVVHLVRPRSVCGRESDTLQQRRGGRGEEGGASEEAGVRRRE